ncbi:ABC transporter permease [Microbispora sp. H10949]|uniref:ABC transporter permease n=1 Tax=Microbispora sp. H10949 TaxID=2729111 RepID=UPI0016049FAD|nr:ABC transporter permease [Microbispora sp. H10949]
MTPVRDVLAVARLGGRLFWRDGRAVGGVAVLGVCLGAGLPLLIAAALRSRDVKVVLGMHLGMLATLLTIVATTQTAVTLSARRELLVLKRLRASGLRGRAIVGGELVNMVTQAALLSALVSVILYTFTYLPPPELPLLFAACVVVVAGVLALIGVVFSIVTRRPDLNAPATIPFMLASALGAGAYGPFVTGLLPGWVRWALDLLPTGAMVEIAGLAYRGGELATLTGPVLNLTVWALLALVAVRFLFRWDPRR